MEPNGRVVGVLKIAADITEAKLRSIENEAKMAALSRVQATIEFKPSGEIIDANDNFFATMRYRRDEIIGKHYRKFVEPSYANSQEYHDFWRTLNSAQPIAQPNRSSIPSGASANATDWSCCRPPIARYSISMAK